jgi:hypothetical protein
VRQTALQQTATHGHKCRETARKRGQIAQNRAGGAKLRKWRQIAQMAQNLRHSNNGNFLIILWWTNVDNGASRLIISMLQTVRIHDCPFAGIILDNHTNSFKSMHVVASLEESSLETV